MITVRRSDTGSFVLVHEPSQIVLVGDDLEATYARMEERLRADPSLDQAAPLPRGPVTRRWAWLAGVGVLALLPFLWLTVLHYTLGRLVDELRRQPTTAPSEEVQTLRAELEALRQVVSRVEDQAGQARGGTPRLGQAGRARRPLEKGTDPSAAPEPNEEGASTGGDTGGTGDEPDEP